MREEEEEDCVTLFCASTLFCFGVSAIVFILTLYGVIFHVLTGLDFKRIWFVTAGVILTWFLIISVCYHRLLIQWLREHGCLLIQWLVGLGMGGMYIYALGQVAVYLIV